MAGGREPNCLELILAPTLQAWMTASSLFWSLLWVHSRWCCWALRYSSS